MAAAVAAVPHVVEDLDAGIGVGTFGRPAATVVAVLLVAVLGGLGIVVGTALRRPLRTLIATDACWAAAAMIDHPGAWTRWSDFRDGASSAAPVLLLVAFGLLSAGLLARAHWRSSRETANGAGHDP